MATFPAGQYEVEVVPDSGDAKRRIIHIRDGSGNLVRPGDRCTDQSGQDLTSLLPAGHTAMRRQLNDIVGYVRNPAQQDEDGADNDSGD